MTSAQKKKFASHKHILRELVKPIGIKKRREILIKQKGGALLPRLLGTILSKVPIYRGERRHRIETKGPESIRRNKERYRKLLEKEKRPEQRAQIQRYLDQ